VSVAGSICGVWICAQGESVEDALDVVFLYGSEEGFVWGGVVGLAGVDGGDVRAVDVLGGYVFEALVAGSVGKRFGSVALGESGLPNHVGDAVADLEESFDNVGGEGGGVEGEGADFGDVRAEGAVDAGAFDAQDYAEVDGDPFNFGFRVAVCAPAVALVVVTDYLKQFGGVFLEAVAVCADVGWAGSDGAMAVDAVCSTCIGGRRVMMMA